MCSTPALIFGAHCAYDPEIVDMVLAFDPRILRYKFLMANLKKQNKNKFEMVGSSTS